MFRSQQIVVTALLPSVSVPLAISLRHYASSDRSSHPPTLADVSASLSEFGFPSVFFQPTELKTRYRELAQQHHPDCGGCDEKMSRIVVAYEVLQRLSDRDKEQFAVQRKFYRGDQNFADVNSWTRSTTQSSSHRGRGDFGRRGGRCSPIDYRETKMWFVIATIVFGVTVVFMVHSAWSNAAAVHKKMTLALQNRNNEESSPRTQKQISLHRQRKEVNDRIHTAKISLLYNSWNHDRESAKAFLAALLQERARLNEEIEKSCMLMPAHAIS